MISLLATALALIALQGPEATDYSAGPPVMERACEAGDLQACNAFAGFLAWSGDNEQRAQAIEIYQTTCDKGYFKSCGNLSASYRYGMGGVEKDKARAFAIDTELCAKEYAPGCTSLAYFYETGEGPKEYAPMTAVTYFTKACDLGDPDGCETGARVLAREGKTTLDKQKAVVLATKGCEMGNEWSCKLKAQLSR